MGRRFPFSIERLDFGGLVQRGFEVQLRRVVAAFAVKAAIFPFVISSPQFGQGQQMLGPFRWRRGTRFGLFSRAAGIFGALIIILLSRREFFAALSLFMKVAGAVPINGFLLCRQRRSQRREQQQHDQRGT